MGWKFNDVAQIGETVAINVLRDRLLAEDPAAGCRVQGVDTSVWATVRNIVGDANVEVLSIGGWDGIYITLSVKMNALVLIFRYVPILRDNRLGADYDFAEHLDKLTAQLVYVGIESNLLDTLQALWESLHGSSAFGRLLEQLRYTPTRGYYLPDGTTAEDVRAMTQIPA